MALGLTAALKVALDKKQEQRLRKWNQVTPRNAKVDIHTHIRIYIHTHTTARQSLETNTDVFQPLWRFFSFSFSLWGGYTIIYKNAMRVHALKQSLQILERVRIVAHSIAHTVPSMRRRRVVVVAIEPPRVRPRVVIVFETKMTTRMM